MEVSGTVLRHVTYVSGAGNHAPRGGVRVWARPRVRMVVDSGFRDEGHVQYYQDRENRQPVLTTKKKLKLLKGSSKGVSLFPQLGFALDRDQRALLDHLQGNLTTDGGEVLVRELEKLRAEEKELKKKRKQEKKAKQKASKMKTKPDPDCESSSSSSESSDSECGGEVVDMNSFRAGVGVAPAPVDELQPPALQSTMLSPPALLPQTSIDGEDSTTPTPHHHAMENAASASVGSVSTGFKNDSNVATTAPQKRIEVCMGGKCKKSGAAALLQQFEREVVGVEGGGAVVACKCMGKCKSAPNVRIQNSVDHGLAEGLDNDSVKVPANPLCIGVGLEDVNTIVARFLGENHKDMGVAAATTC